MSTREERKQWVASVLTEDTSRPPNCHDSGYEEYRQWSSAPTSNPEFAAFITKNWFSFQQSVTIGHLPTAWQEELFAMIYHLHREWMQVFDRHRITFRHRDPGKHLYITMTARIMSTVKVWQTPHLMDRGFFMYQGEHPVSWGEEPGLTRAETIIMHQMMDVFTNTYHTMASNASTDMDAVRADLSDPCQAFTQALIYWGNSHEQIPALANKQT